ncbi:MAG TPA: glucose-6-phosphate isomerase, partial [Planctomycetota bacterium]|nr:glucose-6-phosphate isomerase [Planctomycetota bacterium]
LGGLIALFERTVGYYASLVSINAYHQPGVEAGKKAATAVLAVQAKALAALRAARDAMTAEDVAKKAGLDAERETVFRVLRHLAANPGRGVAADGDRFRAETARP